MLQNYTEGPNKYYTFSPQQYSSSNPLSTVAQINGFVLQQFLEMKRFNLISNDTIFQHLTSPFKGSWTPELLGKQSTTEVKEKHLRQVLQW